VERKPPPIVLKFADEDMVDNELAVKTLWNHSVVKLRHRSLSLAQKVRVDRRGPKRRLLSHGRAVKFIRLNRSVSLPSATLTTPISPTQPVTNGSSQALLTPDKSSPSESKKMRAGVFERTWTDTLADNAVQTASTPEECSKSTPVAEDDNTVRDSVPLPAEDPATLASTNDTAFTADLEDLDSGEDTFSLVNEVSLSFLHSSY